MLTTRLDSPVRQRTSPRITTVAGVLLLVLPTVAAALDPVVLDGRDGVHHLGRHIEILEDPTASLTLADVVAPERAGAFRSAATDVPNFGLTGSAYWVRFAWRTTGTVAREWLLEVPWPVVDSVTAHLPGADGGTVRRQAGDATPFRAWDVEHRNPTFRLALPAAGEGVVYLRFAGDDTMLLPLTLWSADAFERARRSQAFWYGVFYGVIAILIVYNLALWFITRDPSSVYYVLLISAWGFYHASLAGFATQYLWPTSPAWATRSIHLAAVLAFALSAVFARSFLSTRRYAPALDRILLGFAVVGFAFLLWPWLGEIRWFIPIGGAVGLTGAAVLLVSGYRCWRAGYRPARYYLLTWTLAISALFVWALRGYGLAPSNFATDHAFEVVVLSTAITLSLGLADRVNVLRGDLEELNRDLERRIVERTGDLARANRHKSEFLANMSHELRTPLNAVIGFSEVLLARMFGELNPKQAEYVADIHDSGRHLLSLINDILDLSKVEAGRMELELSRFDLPAAVDNAVTLVRERARSHGIALRAHLDDGVGEVVADERKVKQVLVNLLSNAVKFTPPGGTVEVRADATEAGVEITVSDTGVGIDPADRETIFEAFRRAGSNGVRGVEGTGLGLSLAKRMVELHGGHIRVSSEVGKGSAFTFDLPRWEWQAS
jgi:signal transduction histidine kinase